MVDSRERSPARNRTGHSPGLPGAVVSLHATGDAVAVSAPRPGSSARGAPGRNRRYAGSRVRNELPTAAIRLTTLNRQRVRPQFPINKLALPSVISNRALHEWHGGTH